MLRSLVPLRERRLARPVERIVEEMQDMMERFWEEGEGPLARLETYYPKVNLAETDGNLEVSVDLPGMKPEDIKVEMRNGNLVVSGERKEEKEEKGKTYHRIERSYGSFCRTVPLPAKVEEGKIDAKFANGVLSVTLPKSEQTKPKQIAVKT
ncbi:MAG TPA: Hsp20/alpha crystallin family protein [Pirellulales bacterium]|nr:Hsp20/alpha crystallin family protein [Pirellulales bacterium]